MLKFGFKTVNTLLITVLFLLVAVSILAVSYGFISQIDWQTEISLFNRIIVLVLVGVICILLGNIILIL